MFYLICLFLGLYCFIVDDASTHTQEIRVEINRLQQAHTHTHTHRASNLRTIQFIFHCNRRLTLCRLLGSTDSSCWFVCFSYLFQKKKKRNCNTNRPFIDFNRLTSNFEMSIETRKNYTAKSFITTPGQYCREEKRNTWSKQLSQK